jgi:hypothetical protein
MSDPDTLKEIETTLAGVINPNTVVAIMSEFLGITKEQLEKNHDGSTPWVRQEVLKVASKKNSADRTHMLAKIQQIIAENSR